ncbi:thymidine kinase [Cryobacterium sp. BB307]|uniref:thymidine kinase n=1 Tax=Cryobacterium sp. BB307 TaxID=2716317 RepID=UPI001447B99D
MAKLYFRYGAMNSGKSTALLQAAYNYEERGQQVLLAKPQVDTKGATLIVSRLGVTRPVDFMIAATDDVLELFAQARQEVKEETGRDVSCLLVDEAQFLTEGQIDDLLRIAILEDVPVLAYGLRTDFQTVAFPGSRRLLEIAHSLEELKTICRCGRKAVFNARKIGDRFIFDGDQVAIEVGEVVYESLCGSCYLDESGGRLNRGNRVLSPMDTAYNSAPDPDFA